jgi:hypothetical protein
MLEHSSTMRCATATLVDITTHIAATPDRRLGRHDRSPHRRRLATRSSTSPASCGVQADDTERVTALSPHAQGAQLLNATTPPATDGLPRGAVSVPNPPCACASPAAAAAPSHP